MEKNNDGGSKEAEGKIRVAEFTGQKAAQPEWGHSGRLLDDVTRRWERSGGGGGRGGERAREGGRERRRREGVISGVQTSRSKSPPSAPHAGD